MTKLRFESIDKDTGEVWFQGVSATKANPCPVCGKPTTNREGYCAIDWGRGRVWCGHSRDSYQGSFFDVSAQSWTPPPKTVKTVREECSIDWESLQREFLDAGEGMPLHRQAQRLGLTVDSLKQLNAGWSAEFEAVTFPMRDAKGGIIGIRLRKEDGFKFAIRGSRNGLFVTGRSMVDPRLVICEGPTDTAAGAAMGLPIVGRASALTCRDELVKFSSNRDSVVIVRDQDRDGIRGAESLAAALDAVVPDVRIIAPLGVKDLRAWYAKGCTPAMFWATAANAKKWGRS